LIISKSPLASTDRASNLIRAAYTEPNVDIQSGPGLQLFSLSLSPSVAFLVRKKGTLSENPIKGVREFSAKPERSPQPYLIVKQTSAAENPRLGRVPYRYVPVLYLRRSHIWIGAHHIPPLPLPMHPAPVASINLSCSVSIRIYGRNIARVYLYYISRNIEWTSYLLVVREERGCCSPVARLGCALDHGACSRRNPEFADYSRTAGSRIVRELKCRMSKMRARRRMMRRMSCFAYIAVLYALSIFTEVSLYFALRAYDVRKKRNTGALMNAIVAALFLVYSSRQNRETTRAYKVRSG